MRPDLDNRRVIASAGNSAVRASISVSIAAGNQRAWAAVQGADIVDVPVPSLPEIIRSAIQPSGVQSICVAVVEADGTRDVLVMWLTRSAVVLRRRRSLATTTVMQNLRDAAARDRSDARDRAVVEQQARAERQAPSRSSPSRARRRSAGDDADPA